MLLSLFLIFCQTQYHTTMSSNYEHVKNVRSAANLKGRSHACIRCIVGIVAFAVVKSSQMAVDLHIVPQNSQFLSQSSSGSVCKRELLVEIE